MHEGISPDLDIPIIIITDTNYFLQAHHVHAHRHAVMAVGEGESFRAADLALGTFRVRAHGALFWGEGDGVGVPAHVAGPGVVGGGHGGDWAAGLPVRLVVDELVEESETPQVGNEVVFKVFGGGRIRRTTSSLDVMVLARQQLEQKNTIAKQQMNESVNGSGSD
ncbi:MAG: hypothetical protein Q9185_002604 [Variospora sp. 1 TL-2023]